MNERKKEQDENMVQCPACINQTISKCTIMRHILGMAFGRMIGFSPGCSAIGALMSGPWP